MRSLYGGPRDGKSVEVDPTTRKVIFPGINEAFDPHTHGMVLDNGRVVSDGEGNKPYLQHVYEYDGDLNGYVYRGEEEI